MNRIFKYRAVRMLRYAQPVFLMVALSLAGAVAFATLPSAAEGGREIPAPAADDATSGGPQVIVLAGGCFWGVQGVFQHVKGVTSAVSGYAGGAEDTAHYDMVGSGSTGHAESVKVTFDPAQVSLGKILQIYFSVAHDPTQLNRQGPDVGSQYRSEIFATDAEQAGLAKAYIAQLNQARVFDAAIVTRIETGKAFYPAEEYHQDFMTRNPTYPYIVYNDLPKIGDLKQLFPDFYRQTPVLVLASN